MRTFLTVTRSLPEKDGKRKQRGFDEATPSAKERWESDGYRFAPYQYQEKNMVVDGNALRPLSKDER